VDAVHALFVDCLRVARHPMIPCFSVQVHGGVP
jgi:hypothetical protein